MWNNPLRPFWRGRHLVSACQGGNFPPERKIPLEPVVVDSECGSVENPLGVSRILKVENEAMFPSCDMFCLYSECCFFLFAFC